MKIFIYSLLFIVWIMLILLTRIYGLDVSPQSAGFDEVSLGYNAYSLLLTGKDEYGTPFPLSLRSYNDFKPALYSYLAMPFIAVFGLNDSSIRLPSAVLGTLSILFTLLILRKIGKPRHILTDMALVTIIAFFPWRLHFSRVAFEANISMSFFTGAVYCLLNYKQNIFYKIGLIIFSALSIYSYHAARLAIPILLILYFTDPLSLQFKNIIKKPLVLIKNMTPLFIIFLIYIPLFLEANTFQILTRFRQTNIFTHFYPFTPGEIVFMSSAWLNPIGHPLYYLGGYISGHIFSYLSPKNLSLLIYPGVIKSAQAIGGTGMLGFAGGIFFSTGLFASFKKFLTDRNFKFLIYWILAGIAPAAVTWEWFYPLRSINIYPAIDIIAASGLIFIFSRLINTKITLIKYVLTGLVLLLISVTSIHNLQNEYKFGAWETSGEFQPGGFKEGAGQLTMLKDKYKTVYIDSNQAQSYAILWYYMKYPPQKVQSLTHLRNIPGKEGPAYINFDNFVFKKFDWPNDKKLNNFAFWTNSEVKENEIESVTGTTLTKILSPTGEWIASIITKD